MVVDALDNFATRYVLNHAALQLNLPLFHGAVQGFEGRATTIIAGKTPCLKCIYPRVPQPDVIPVIGVAPAMIASLQATEVIKYILGMGELLTGRLLVYDGLSMEFMQVKLKPNADCPDCALARKERA
jgi:molybdopterin/thiamine biosynthesis adenylyltransferase